MLSEFFKFGVAEHSSIFNERPEATDTTPRPEHNILVPDGAWALLTNDPECGAGEREH